MRRSIALLIVAVSLLTATCVAGRKHDNQLLSNAARIRAGMTAEEALGVLGNPAWRGECGAKFPYGWRKDCAAELGYSSTFAPLLPSYVVVQLDGRARVIAADTIISP